MRLSARLLVLVSLVFAACPPPPATESLAISPASLSLEAGETRPLSAQVKSGTTTSAATGATWSSSNEAIVTVSSAGDGSATVQGLTPGTATLTAKVRTLTASVSVTVSARFVTLTRIELTPATATLAKGTSLQLAATGVFSDGSTADITSTSIWTSAAPAILTVDGAGLVRGLSAGQTQVTVAKDGITATLPVTVSSATIVAIDVTPALPSLARGTTQQLSATARLSDTTTQDVTSQVTWTSSTAATATVDAAGLVTALELGTSTVTATLNAVSGSTTVTVTAATLAAIDVTPTTPVVPRGRTEQLTATGRFSDGTTQDLSSQATWSAAPTSVATVDSAGLVTAVAVGSASITATLGAVSGTTTLTVSSAVLVSLSVTPSAPSVARGLTRSFIATGLFSDSTTQDLTNTVTWSSSAPGVASISNAAGSEGLATAQSIGTTTITAASAAISGSTILTVTAASVTSLQVAPTTATLPRGLTLQYTATALLSDGTMQDLTTTVTWTTGSSAFATISNAAGSEGLLRAVAVGSSTVVATLGTVSANTTVTVTSARLDRIDVTPSAPSVARGRTTQLTATGVYSDATTQNLTTAVTWASTAASVATISNAAGTEGLLTAVNPGSATVSATLGTVVGSQPVTITAADLVSLAVTPALPSIAKGRTQQFTATGTYSDATFQDLTTQVTWTTGTPATATVSNATGSVGLGSALALGTTTVIATLGTVSGNTTLTVTAAELVSIALAGAPATLPLGRTADLTATGTYSDASTQNLTTQVTWSSAPVSMLTVSNVTGSVGRITGVAVGSATVTATLGSVSGQATIGVTAAVLESLVVVPAGPAIAKGRTQQFVATGTYSDATTANLTTSVTWGSTATASLTISNAAGSQGLASAIALGTGSVTAQSGSITGSTLFTVTPAVLVSIAVGPINPSVALGRTQQFSAVGTYSDATTQLLTTTVGWSSGNLGAATISNASGSEGLATSVSVGTSLITATSGAITGSTTLTVTPPALVSIAVTPATPTLALGTFQQFVATGTYSDLTTQVLTTTVTWASTDALVLGVSNVAGTQGRGSALAIGTATLTATSGSVVGSTFVSVNGAALVSIAVTPANSSLAKGRTLQLTARGTYSDATTQDLTTLVTWSSTTGATATVSALGLATAVDVGTTTVTATLGAVSGNTGLTVTPAALVSIAVTGAPAFLPLGRTASLVATGTYSDTSTQVITSSVTWGSLPVTTFSISGAGVVTALAVGTGTITATLGAVSSRGTNIDATPAVLESIAVTPAGPTLAKGLMQQLVATGTYSDATTLVITGTVTWASTDGSVATVSATGLANAVSVGTTTVSATSGAVSGNTLLTVGPAVLVSIAVTGAPGSLPLGRTAVLTATGTYSDLSTLDLSALVTWTTSPLGQVFVNSFGVATAVAIGTPTVTATLGSVSGFTTVNTVAAVLESIAVTPSTPSKAKGLTQQFTAMGTYSDATTLDLTATATWASTFPAFVTITGGGLATAFAVGSSTISATSGTVSGNTDMTVTPATIVSIAVTPVAPSVNAGSTVQLTATATLTDTTTSDVTTTATWVSQTVAAATVNATGLVTGVAVGTSQIDATANSVTGSTTVTVAAPPPVVLSTVPASAATGISALAPISVTFDRAVTPGSVTVQSSAGPCFGSLQVSRDDFASCIALGAPVFSGGNTIATVTPAPALVFGATYKIRVTTSVTSSLGTPLASTFTLAAAFTTAVDNRCATGLVISQVYGGGGNAGATYTNDFIEIHNASPSAINITGFAVQYASSAGTTWTVTALPAGSIPAGGYFLVQEASQAAIGAPLPTPDAAATIAMAAGAGKVALTNTATALSGTCPSGGALLDLVGYGGANCFEGAGPTGALTSTSSAQRKRGCIDENVNSTDFAVALPIPRNSAIANRAVCACTLNETDLTAEADYCNLQFPVSILVQTGTLTPTVYTRLFETAVTPPAGSDPSVIAQVGYGPVTVNPENQAGWVWAAAPFNLQVGSDDEYQLGFTAPAAGSYRYTGRYSRDGTNWTYCDLDGAGSNVGIGFDLTQLGILTVTP